MLFAGMSVGLILTSIAAAVVSTVPAMSGALRSGLVVNEVFASLFFAVEYVLRLWTATELAKFRQTGRWRAALTLALTPAVVLDALGVLPLVVVLMADRTGGIELMLNVLRFFRLARYSPGLANVGRVFVAEWRALAATAMIGPGMLLLSATAPYLLECEAQPDQFASIPMASYWAIVTLATVGYGDVVPVTAAGKAAAFMVIVAGLIFFARPIAIISTSFVAEVRRRDFNISYGMVARVPLFSTLDALEISELAGLLKSRRVPRDVTIVRKGDPGERTFFIAKGQVEVHIPVGRVRLDAGDFFGEIAVIGCTSRTATVVASISCDLLLLDAAALPKLTE